MNYLQRLVPPRIKRRVAARLPITLLGPLVIDLAISRLDSPSRRRQHVVTRVVEMTCRQVEAGLFARLVLPSTPTWGYEDYAAMLLGTYEQELHEPLAKVVQIPPDSIINLGCASGLYASGLARLLRGCPVIVVDLLESALQATNEAWSLNALLSTNELTTIHGELDFQQFERLLAPFASPLVIADIEGSEKELFEPEMVPSLAKAIIICELHDTIAPGTSDLMARRFQDSHSIQLYRSGSRNPHQHELLSEFSEHDRWLAISEARDGDGVWMVAVPAGVEE